MAVPKRKLSRTKTRSRRSHHGRKPMKFAVCTNCKAPIPSHTPCPSCGMYKGRQVLNVSRKLERLEKQRKAKVSAS